MHHSRRGNVFRYTSPFQTFCSWHIHIWNFFGQLVFGITSPFDVNVSRFVKRIVFMSEVYVVCFPSDSKLIPKSRLSRFETPNFEYRDLFMVSYLPSFPKKIWDKSCIWFSIFPKNEFLLNIFIIIRWKISKAKFNFIE